MQDLTILIIGFIAIVITLVVGHSVIIGRELHSRKEESQCPECHKYWAREDLDRELMGIFQKSTLLMRGNIANWRWVVLPHEKYRLYHRCMYCGHEWTSTETRRL
jgi:hypothetical protein